MSERFDKKDMKTKRCYHFVLAAKSSDDVLTFVLKKKTITSNQKENNTRNTSG